VTQPGDVPGEAVPHRRLCGDSGAGFAREMAAADPGSRTRSFDIKGLFDTFEEKLELAMKRFAGIDIANVWRQQQSTDWLRECPP